LTSRESKRQGARLVAIGLAVTLTVLAAPRLLPFAAAAEAWLADLRIALLTPAPATQDREIAVLTITEDTLALFPYRSPVDRGFLAKLLAALEQAEVRAVGLDILFDQASEVEKDAALAEAIAGFPGPVVVAWADDAAGLTEAQQDYLNGFIAASGARPGFTNLIKDADGVVRRQLAALPKSSVPSFPAALAEAVGTEGPDHDFAVAWRVRPTDGSDTFQVLPAHLVVEYSDADPSLVKGWLEDRIVLIGADLPQGDRHRTPFAADPQAPDTMPGVLLHAHVLAQLLEGRRRPEIGLPIEVLFALVLAAAGVGLATLHIPIAARLAVAAGVVIAVWSGGFILYHRGGPIVPLALPSFGLLAAYGVSSATLGYAAAKAKRFIRNAFAHYVPPALVTQLTNEPERLVLGGERREITLIFTDIAGFTKLSERLPPEVLMPLLNEYLDGMSRIVLEHGGTIDKFIGDAVVTFFGAPGHQPDHAARAVACALALDSFAEAFRQAHAEYEVGITRIGVHSGPAVVGNVGGSARFDYTAIGDTVNTAARLESANKHLGTRLCISAATAAATQDVPMRPVGELVLKGKRVGIAAFEPIPADQAASAEEARYRAAYETMAAGKTEAREAFARLAESHPDDGLIAFHLRRLDEGATSARIELEEK
jgi:class 3 adenylate cyclase